MRLRTSSTAMSYCAAVKCKGEWAKRHDMNERRTVVGKLTRISLTITNEKVERDAAAGVRLVVGQPNLGKR
jgi:hypothetical protein